MSKKINISIALRTLTNKKCKIFKTLDNSVDVIDISKAENLGNKSWGYLDYFAKNGYSIIGWNELQKVNASFYPTKETKTIKSDKLVIQEKEQKWHSYADFAHLSVHNGKEYISSEYSHLKMLNHFTNKFNPIVFIKGRKDRIELKNRKKHLDIKFTGIKIFSSAFERVEEIPKN